MNNQINTIDRKELEIIKVDLSPNTFVAEVDGTMIQSWTDYWNKISKAFVFPKLPSYMKKDYHCYYDLMTDLNWISTDSIVLIINNFNVFLSDDKALRNSIINDYNNYLLPFWNEEVESVVVAGKKKTFKIYVIS